MRLARMATSVMKDWQEERRIRGLLRKQKISPLWMALSWKQLEFLLYGALAIFFLWAAVKLV